MESKEFIERVMHHFGKEFGYGKPSNLTFAREAEKLSGCSDGIRQIASAQSEDEMIDCFLSKIDFCLAKNFPDKELLKKYYREAMEKKGVYIDRSVTLKNEEAVEKVNGVFLGDCKAELFVDRFAVSRIYVKHSGHLTVTARDFAFVKIDALDNAEIEVVATEKARVYINIYANAVVHTTGEENIKLIHKNKETYELHD